MGESKLLKVISIIMLVGAIITLIAGIIGVVGVAALAALTGANSGLLTVSAIIGLIGGVIELIAAIIGIKASKDPSKAQQAITWGIIVIVLSVISMILNLVGGGEFSVVSLITALIIPVLYLIGAFQLKKA